MGCMTSPFLYFADEPLSRAELMAARLDGDLVELGEAWIPADAVETRALRAGSLGQLLGEDLAATHLSAAWVHGAVPEPPRRHAVQRAVARRLHHRFGVGQFYRDRRVEEADLWRVGGVWVTDPARTLADLARVADDRHLAAARMLAAGDPDALERAIRLLQERRSLPHKRTALTLLRGMRGGAAKRGQDDVTR